MPFLNLADIRECTEAEGPGKRFAIWSQGCPRKCPGCCNPGMQPMVRKYIVDTSDLKKLIQQSMEQNQIEGVSFIGGEPMLQAEGFADVAIWCHENNLSVLVFSGFLYQELIDLKNPFVDSLLSNIDILVDGPFVQSKLDYERDWVGSTNQKVIFLSNRYSPGIESVNGERRVECFVSKKSIEINGWPIKII